jgi:predicted translin family RNA/ssDNA-binding protein
MPTTTTAIKQQRTARTPSIETDVVEDVKTNVDTSVRHGQLIEERCVEIPIRISWFARSAKLQDEFAEKARAAIDVSDSALNSFSKRLFASTHPAVRATNAAKNEIQRYVAHHTIPATLAGTNVKDPGRRLLLVDKLPDFLKGLESRKQKLFTAATALQAAMPEIKAERKEALGKAYDEGDYPLDVRSCIDVIVGTPQEVSVVASLKALDEELYEKESARARQRIDASIQAYVVEFGQILHQKLDDFAASLANRRRISPSMSGPFAPLREAEILHEETEGKTTTYELRLKKAAVWQEKRYEKGAIVTIAVPTEEAYAALQPRSTSERRKVYGSSIQAMQEMLGSFREIAEMVGPSGESVSKMVDRVEKQFQSLSVNPEAAAEQLRAKSDKARQELNKTLNELGEELSRAVHLVGSSRREVDF